MSKNNITSINKKRRFKIRFDIGVFIFSMIILYMFVSVFRFMTSKHISVYEVKTGSILTDTAYTGFAVRSEHVAYSKDDGYIHFLVDEGSKVADGSSVYTVTNTKDADIRNFIGNKLTKENKKEMIYSIRKFSSSFDPSNFQSADDFTYDCRSAIFNYQNENRDSGSGSAFDTFRSDADGIIAFSIDGFEKVSTKNFKTSYLSRDSYSKSDIRESATIKSGDPAYKLITDEIWYLYFMISNDTAKQISKNKVSNVSVLFKKDTETVNGTLETKRIDGSWVAQVKFCNSVVRYANDRFLDVELILNSTSGLKIPKSSVVKRSYYPVPQNFVSKGGNTNELGVFVKKNSGGSVFKPIKIISYKDNKYYISDSSLKSGTILVEPDTKEESTYTIGKKEVLTGAYNVNKGYAVFKTVQILSSNDEYYIVMPGGSYNLSNYDQIVLNAKDIKDGQIIFE